MTVYMEVDETVNEKSVQYPCEMGVINISKLLRMKVPDQSKCKGYAKFVKARSNALRDQIMVMW